jgi:siroheme synthase-like protein
VPVDAPLFPVGLVVAGRPCLVVGGGRIAARKVEGLLDCGARVTVIAPEIDESIADRPEVTLVRRTYRRGDVRGFRLVIAATGDPEVSAAVFDDGEAAGVWVNAADDPPNCSFTLPAIARRGPVTVTVATGGHSPALAAWLRDRLAAELDALDGRIGDVALALSSRRDELLGAGETTEGRDWTPVIESLLAARDAR